MSYRQKAIFVDDNGHPLPCPIRNEYPEDFDGWLAWTQAFYDWKRNISNRSNAAFDKAFRAERARKDLVRIKGEFDAAFSDEGEP